MLKRLNKSIQKGLQQRLLAAAPGFIDVKRLIAELSDEELMRSADEYRCV